jgi:tetratricopeptide (TPR) repeat protein
MGRLEIWRLTGYKLVFDTSVLVCEPRTLDQVFLKDGNEIHGWMYDYPSGDVAPTVQIWNDQKNEYELTLWDGRLLEQAVAEFENEINPPPSLENIVNQIEQQYPDVEAMRQALPDLEMLINNPPADTDNHLLVKAHYLHALALEALNRPDDALAEYVALYQAAPDSAWGRLAALHFEPIN